MIRLDFDGGRRPPRPEWEQQDNEMADDGIYHSARPWPRRVPKILVNVPKVRCVSFFVDTTRDGGAQNETGAD